MAQVREELTLVDKFTAQFTKFISLAKQAATATSKIPQQQEAIKWKQLEIQRATEQVNHSTNRLLGTVKSLAGAYLGMQGVSLFTKTADMLTQSAARIERMNDGLQTTAQLQNMVFQAAQNTWSNYASMLDNVSKLGTLAGNAFSSTAEVVAFSEQLAKQFALAGTSAEGQAAAMLQLTQAMGSGVLRGEELNSVLEQVPNIVQTIADYMGTTVAGVRELASDGAVTAEIVKNAMLSAAEETNAAFEKIPMTFSQAWTLASNMAVRAFQPAMQKANDLLNSELGQKALNGLIAGFQILGNAASVAIDLIAAGAQFVADNWDVVSAILVGVGVAALVAGGQMVDSGIASAAAWAAANWPLLLVAGSVALIIFLARKMGATWEEIGGVVGGVFMLLYAFAMNGFIVPAQNQFAMFANFIGNLFNDPAAAVKILFLDLAQFIVDKIAIAARAIETLINKIPNVKVDLTSGLTDLQNSIAQKSQEIKDASGWKEYVKKWDYVDYVDAWNKGSSVGGGIGAGLDNFNMNDLFGGLSSGIGEVPIVSNDLSSIAADTSSIKKSVSLSEEDLSMLADMAERQYVNKINLTSQAPVITVTGANTGNTELDRRNMADAIKRILLEEAASATTNSYARV